MAVTYNKINWDEETPITVANLDRIDVGIDEVVTQSNSNESRITTNEGDISNIEDGTTDVGNALALQNESLEVVAEGMITIDDDSEESIQLLSATEHYKYFFSVYANGATVYQGYHPQRSCAVIYKQPSSLSSDFLKIINRGTTTSVGEFYYKVWALR